MNQDQGKDNTNPNPQVTVDTEPVARSYPRKAPATPSSTPGDQVPGDSASQKINPKAGRPKKGNKNRDKGASTPQPSRRPAATPKPSSKVAISSTSKQDNQPSANLLTQGAKVSTASTSQQPNRPSPSLHTPQQARPIVSLSSNFRTPVGHYPSPALLLQTQAQIKVAGPSNTQLSPQPASNRVAPTVARLPELLLPVIPPLREDDGLDSEWVKEQVRRVAQSPFRLLDLTPPEWAIYEALKRARLEQEARLQASDSLNPQATPDWPAANALGESLLQVTQVRLRDLHYGEASIPEDAWVTLAPRVAEKLRYRADQAREKARFQCFENPERLQEEPEWVKELIRRVRHFNQQLPGPFQRFPAYYPIPEGEQERLEADRPIPQRSPLPQFDFPAKALVRSEATPSVEISDLPETWIENKKRGLLTLQKSLIEDIPGIILRHVIHPDYSKPRPRLRLPSTFARPHPPSLADIHVNLRRFDLARLQDFLQANINPEVWRQSLSLKPSGPQPLLLVPRSEGLPVPNSHHLPTFWVAEKKQSLSRLQGYLRERVPAPRLQQILFSESFPRPQRPKSPERCNPYKDLEKYPQGAGTPVKETDFHHFYAPFPYEDYDELDAQRQKEREELAAIQSSSVPEIDFRNDGDETEREDTPTNTCSNLKH